MTDNEKCPGCHKPFKPDAITGVFRWPLSDSREQLKWHVRCHQDAYYRTLERRMKPVSQL